MTLSGDFHVKAMRIHRPSALLYISIFLGKDHSRSGALILAGVKDSCVNHRHMSPDDSRCEALFHCTAQKTLSLTEADLTGGIRSAVSDSLPLPDHYSSMRDSQRQPYATGPW